MNLTVTSFGGIMIHTSKGIFAVNGGGSLEEMEESYIQPEHPLAALILTSEHCTRSRNAERFVQKHHIPLLTSFITQCKMRLSHIPVIGCFPPAEINLYGIKIGFHHIRCDSIDPVFITLEDDEKSGIVTDGRLSSTSAVPLMNCSKIILMNETRQYESASPALRRRILSVCNTREELAELFQNYRGRIIRC